MALLIFILNLIRLRYIELYMEVFVSKGNGFEKTKSVWLCGHDPLKILLKCWLSEKWGVCEEGNTSHSRDAQILNYIASHFSTGEHCFV